MGRNYKNVEEHLNAYRWIDNSSVYNGTPCWRWFGAKTSNGYGTVTINYENVAVHRLVAQMHLGLDPKDKTTQVCHHCDVKDCFNPGHLFLGTSSDNTIDSSKKGRHFNGSKTHCPKGHEYTPENTVMRKWARSCRICEREKAAKYRETKKDRLISDPRIDGDVLQ